MLTFQIDISQTITNQREMKHILFTFQVKIIMRSTQRKERKGVRLTIPTNQCNIYKMHAYD